MTRPVDLLFPDCRNAQVERRCVNPPIGCGQALTGFRDDVSATEYTLSSLCQACQDAVFGTEGEGAAWPNDVMEYWGHFRMRLRTILGQHGIPSNPGWSETDILSAVDQLGARSGQAEADVATLRRELEKAPHGTDCPFIFNPDICSCGRREILARYKSEE